MTNVLMLGKDSRWLRRAEESKIYSRNIMNRGTQMLMNTLGKNTCKNDVAEQIKAIHFF